MHAPGDRRPIASSRAGILAAGPALVALLAFDAANGTDYIESIGEGLLRYVPLPLFDALIAWFGPLAKVLLGAAVAAGILLVGAAGGSVAGRVTAYRALPGAARAAVAAAIAWLAAAIVPAILGSDPFFAGAEGPLVARPTVVVAAVAYGLVLAVLVGREPRASAEPGADAGSSLDGGGVDATGTGRLGRRAFLRRGAAIVGGASLGAAALALVARTVGALGSLPALRPSASARPLVDAFGASPSVTPVGDFYVVAKGIGPTVVDGAAWRLAVRGLVERPVELTLDELRAMPSVEGYRTLQCISNPVVEYGPYIGNQRWKGLPLRDLLATVGVLPEARSVLWRAADDFGESLPLAAALDERTWLVYEMGPPGTPLTVEHGFPLRILIPGRYGMKQPKHLVSIELAVEEVPGFWVERGWDRDAIVRTYSRIDRPVDGERVPATAPLLVYGVASSGDRGIARVEVSADGGSTWREAELETGVPARGELTWARWRARFDPPGPAGAVRVLVARATDGRGEVQDARIRDPLPSGATGLHRVAITAVD